ncbi:MAG TPA: MMPL family transporter [Solirubrobacteraceae bacterium]|nr:MMPL family transporter [Solirubrobacteraceae bacterium]
MTTSGAGFLSQLGGWSARHRRWILLAWVCLVVGATLAHRAVGSVFSDTLTIPGSAAQHGLNTLRAHDPKGGGVSGQLVYSTTSGKLSADQAAIEQANENVAKLPHVLSVSDPLSAGTTSKDGMTAYATVHFDTNPQNLGEDYVTTVDRAVAPATSKGVDVSYGGALGQAAVPKANDINSELIGFAVALIVLLIGFGSVYAALMPLLTALLGVVAGIGLLGTLAAAISFGTASPTLATMMGLGVGIDYALFLITRHRQLLIDGEDSDTAIRRTMANSGHSLVIAGSTVIIAMLGLYASGISFIGKLGLAASITVAVAMLAGLTLVPAMLGFAREGIDRFAVRRAVAEPIDETGRLHAYTHAVARHPWRFALSGIALLLVLAIPMLSMTLGHVGAGSEPRSYSERQAYDAISKGFGPGANGPLTIVVSMPKNATASQRSSLEQSLPATLAKTPGVASVTPLKASPDNAILIGSVIPTTGPDSTATENLQQQLQNEVLPDALASDHATADVTGTTAATNDFGHTVASRLPVIIGVVLVAAFLVLLMSFRSPLVALKAALLNLLSIGAAYGILVAVFQWGWGSSLLGVSGTVPIESYVPMIIFAIVFGLSMDYEVFLVSRIREHWLATGDNVRSVALGLDQTARVITCAAVILASVFFAFLLSTSVVVKMLALGLGASVIIDATVIRMMIVPALMFVFDRGNWWIPAWLDRVLPRLEPEPEVPAAEPVIPAPVAPAPAPTGQA